MDTRSVPDGIRLKQNVEAVLTAFALTRCQMKKLNPINILHISIYQILRIYRLFGNLRLVQLTRFFKSVAFGTILILPYQPPVRRIFSLPWTDWLLEMFYR